MSRINCITPGQSWSTANGLDYEAVLRDLDVPVTIHNIQAVALGKALIESFRMRPDGSFFINNFPAPGPGEMSEHAINPLYVVSFGHTDHGVPSIYCTCDEWMIHHRHPGMLIADPKWLCKHGVALLLGSGYSRTYLDWLTLPYVVKTPPPPQVDEYDEGIDRRRFYGALGRINKALARHGVSGDMVQEYYRNRFGSGSLSTITQEQWALAGAEVEAMTQSVQILAERAAQVKAALGGAA